MVPFSKANTRNSISYFHIDDMDGDPYVSYILNTLQERSKYCTPGALKAITFGVSHYVKKLRRQYTAIPLNDISRRYIKFHAAAHNYALPVSIEGIHFR